MTERTIKVGDVVVLRSGGPEMTVGGLMQSSCICQWFVGSDDRTATFHRDALRLVRPLDND